MRGDRCLRSFGLLLVSLAGCESVEPTIAPQWPADAAAAPLSREDCVRLALESAPTAAAWNARVAGAKAALDQARRLPNPTLVIDWEDLGLDHGPMPVPVQRTLTLVMSLADLIAMPWRIDAAEFDRAATAADVAAERLQVTADVRTAYDELVTARRRVALAAELVQVADRQRDAVAKFVAVGERPAVELDRARAEVESALAEEASAAADARIREVAFAFELGFQRPVALALSDGLTTDDGAPPAVELEERLREAAERRPELVAAVARYRAGLERERLKQYRVELLPTVSVGRRHTGTENSYVAAIDVLLPVFDQGQAAVDAASAELLAAAAEVRRAAQTIASEVALSHERLVAASSFLADHARPLADRRVDLARAAEALFEAGEATFDDVMTARRDEVAARVARLESEAALAVAAVRLDAALGRSNHDG